MLLLPARRDVGARRQVAILTGPEGPVLPDCGAIRDDARIVLRSSPVPQGRCCPTGPDGPVLLGPMNGYDLYLVLRSSPVPKGRCCAIAAKHG